MRQGQPGRTPGLLVFFTITFSICYVVGPNPAQAQERNSDLEALRREVEELRRRDVEKQRKLDEMQRKLEALESRPASAATQPTATSPAGVSPLDQAVGELPSNPQATSKPSAAAVDAAVDAVIRDATGSQPKAGGSALRLMDVSFDVLVAGGGSTVPDSSLATLQGGDHDPRKNGFTLQNAELSLGGAIDPYFVGQANIVYTLDPVVGETNVELEEAFLVTQSLPYNLQVKAGQFFTEFGRLNARHPHQWEWIDQPIINTRLFGPDGMRGTGLRLSWLAPLPWYSEFYFGAQNANGETMSSFLANEEFFGERPVGNRPFVGRDGNAFNSLAYLIRWENGFDVSDTVSAAFGVSTVFGPNATGPGGYTFIYGADLVVKWRPTRNERGYPYVVWQSEIMYRDYHADSFSSDDVVLKNNNLVDWGTYTQVLYGWTPGWRGGLRLEYATGSGESVGGRENDPFRDNRIRISPLIEWLPSEFSRIRFQVNYDHAEHLEHNDAFTFWIGFEYLIGSHAAHRY